MTRSAIRILVLGTGLALSAGALLALPHRAVPRRVDVVIEASMGHYTPRAIQVHRGDTLHVTLKAMDTAHGFKVQGHDNIDITAMPGMPAEVSFVVDWDGGLEWFCTFNCGPQHGSMSGMIVATDAKD
jgi:heme/copper-type cytochrome/quinol oxidase subunit 2